MTSIWHHVLFLWTTAQIGITSAQEDEGLVISDWSTPSHLVTFPDIVDKRSTTAMGIYNFTNFASITSIASNPSKQHLFIMLSYSYNIYRISNFNIWMNKSLVFHSVWSGISPSYARMAFDWVTENIYWTDVFYKWIAMKPVYSSDPTMYTILLHLDMDRPQAITLDPDSGFLFWSDNGANVRIERATLAGHDRKVLVHTGLLLPFDLSVDPQTKTLYWVDYNRHTVESIDYEGNNRRVIRRLNLNEVTSLDYYKGKLYVSCHEQSWIIVYDAVSGDVDLVYENNFTKPYSVHIYSKDRYPMKIDPCDTTNCGHMCVNTPLGPTCLCKSNYMLSENNATCSASSRYLERSIVATTASSICVLDVRRLAGSGSLYCYTGFQNVGLIASGLDGIYFADLGSKEIKYMTWDNQVTRRVTQTGTVTSMVYTWIDNFLFWIDAATSSIKYKDLDLTATTSANLYTNITEPSHLTMDQHGRSMFLITGRQGQKEISRGDTTGSSMNVVLRAGALDNPVDLNYDLITHRLFFIDRGFLKSVSVEGTRIHSHRTVGSALGFIIYKTYVTWMDGSPSLYYSFYNSTTTQTLPLNMTGITELAVHDVSQMTDNRGPCTIMNGGCEQICLPGNNGSVCKCHHGYTLHPDGSCNSSSVVTDFVLVSDYLHNTIYQISLSGEQQIALDIPFVESPTCAVYHNVTRKIIWAEIKSKQIKSAFLNGSNIETLFSIGTNNLRYIAVDYSTDNIYFTTQDLDSVNKRYVGVFRGTFSIRKTLVSGLGYPVGIALYPSKGIMFWADAGASPHIGKAGMDGVVIFRRSFSDMKWPNGITVDYKADNIYWTDGYYNTIHRSDINGANKVIIATDAKAHLMDIVVMGSHLYYTAWNRRKVTKIDKNGNIVHFMSDSPELGRLDSVYVFPSEPQPINSECAERNGRCSVFCLPNEQGHVCGCPDNQNIKADQRTCDRVLVCPSDILNGQLSSSCLGYVDEECQYTCIKGYTKRHGVDVIKCDSSGSWNEDINSLCEAIKCPGLFHRGNIAASCDRNIGSQCSFTCKDTYKKTTDVSFVTCLSDGQWDRSPDLLCLVRDTTEKQSGNSAAIGTDIGVGVSLAVIIGIVVSVIAVLKCRKQKPKSDTTPTACSNTYQSEPHMSFTGVRPKYQEDTTDHGYCVPQPRALQGTYMTRRYRSGDYDNYSKPNLPERNRSDNSAMDRQDIRPESRQKASRQSEDDKTQLSVVESADEETDKGI